MKYIFPICNTKTKMIDKIKISYLNFHKNGNWQSIVVVYKKC